MWGIRNEFVTMPNSVIYIAPKLDSYFDDYGNEITNYGEPTKYFIDIQPVIGTSEIQAYGELTNRMKIAIIPKKLFKNSIKEFDLAYLDGNKPVDESFYGERANYRVYGIVSQNAVVKVYFLKIVKGE